MSYIDLLMEKKKGVFHQLLEFKVGRDSSSRTSCTSWAADSAQFPSAEPDHVCLTV